MAVRFVERRERDLLWLADAEFAGPLEALGWPAVEAVARATYRGASSGRAATAVLRLSERSERIHLRPVRRGGLLGPLWRGTLLGTARPVEELRVNAKLLDAGAPVPRPVLVAAHRVAGPFWKVVLGTVHAENALDGLAWLASEPDPARLRRGAIAIGRALRRFHDVGGAHADLHAKNVLLFEREDRAEALVIDLDRARAGAPPSAARRMRELMRLVRGLHKRDVMARVGARGLAAGFGAYCGRDRALRRALLDHLPTERRRIARHRAAYR